MRLHRKPGFGQWAFALLVLGLALLGAVRPLLLARSLYMPLLLCSLLAGGLALHQAGLLALLNPLGWRRGQLLEDLLMAMLAGVVGLVAFVFAYLALLGGVPSLLHGWSAEPTEIEVRIDHFAPRAGTRGCAYDLRVSSPRYASTWVPCSLAIALRGRAVEGEPIRLGGTRSWLGFRYQALVGKPPRAP
ncbi:hypothetical protein [Pseudomonas sp. RIT-PI-AD]|uniref:hypothetical protein n=1 Tax=Pseudomonas sp. RIT-PI-AD TaxID=3035294 RepID=UPI0021D96880|nr:hypothetical protein [Pseudomonas sp. RIT-PI-AD]